MRKRGREVDKRVRRAPPGGFACTALIVVPKTLLKNWANELDQWGSFSYVTAYDKHQLDSIDAMTDRRAEICITTCVVQRFAAVIRTLTTCALAATT